MIKKIVSILKSQAWLLTALTICIVVTIIGSFNISENLLSIPISSTFITPNSLRIFIAYQLVIGFILLAASFNTLRSIKFGGYLWSVWRYIAVGLALTAIGSFQLPFVAIIGFSQHAFVTNGGLAIIFLEAAICFMVGLHKFLQPLGRKESLISIKGILLAGIISGLGTGIIYYGFNPSTLLGVPNLFISLFLSLIYLFCAITFKRNNSVIGGNLQHSFTLLADTIFFYSLVQFQIPLFVILGFDSEYMLGGIRVFSTLFFISSLGVLYASMELRQQLKKIKLAAQVNTSLQNPYVDLAEAIIQKHITIIGRDLAINKARSSKYIIIDDNGSVISLDNEHKAIEKLVSAYEELLGVADQSFLEEIVISITIKYPDIQLPPRLQAWYEKQSKL